MDIQENLFNEIASILTKNTILTKDVINKMKFLKNVIKESLR